jgi:hypothetical protein
MDITKNSMLRRDHHPQPQPQPQPQQLRIEELPSIINIINMAPPDRSIRGVFRRDYKHMHNPPLNSYLIDDSLDDSPTNNPPIDADADANDDDTIDTNSVAEPAIDPAIICQSRQQKWMLSVYSVRDVIYWGYEGILCHQRL